MREIEMEKAGRGDEYRWMWSKRKRNHEYSSAGGGGGGGGGGVDDSSWEEQAFAEDAAGLLGGCVWPPRSYSCSFCRREFRSAQALGGHMNVHRRDRARLKQFPPHPPPPQNHEILHQRRYNNNNNNPSPNYYSAANSSATDTFVKYPPPQNLANNYNLTNPNSQYYSVSHHDVVSTAPAAAAALRTFSSQSQDQILTDNNKVLMVPPPCTDYIPTSHINLGAAAAANGSKAASSVSLAPTVPAAWSKLIAAENQNTTSTRLLLNQQDHHKAGRYNSRNNDCIVGLDSCDQAGKEVEDLVSRPDLSISLSLILRKNQCGPAKSDDDDDDPDQEAAGAAASCHCKKRRLEHISPSISPALPIFFRPTKLGLGNKVISSAEVDHTKDVVSDHQVRKIKSSSSSKVELDLELRLGA